MSSKTRNIKKYSFKKPDLTRLRELGSQVTNLRNFWNCHGRDCSTSSRWRLKMESWRLWYSSMTCFFIVLLSPTTNLSPLLRSTWWVKLQVYGSTEVVKREYRSNSELFNLIKRTLRPPEGLLDPPEGLTAHDKAQNALQMGFRAQSASTSKRRLRQLLEFSRSLLIT